MHETPTVEFLKRFATTHRTKALAEGKAMTHTQALEETAHIHGFKNWNTAAAAAKRQHAAGGSDPRKSSVARTDMRLFGTTVTNGSFYLELTVAAPSPDRARRAFLAFIGDDREDRGRHASRPGDALPGAEGLELSLEGFGKLSDRLRRALGRLTNRERFVLAERSLKDPPTPLDTLAALHGVSRGRISQFEQQARERLRTIMGQQDGAAHARTAEGGLADLARPRYRWSEPQDVRLLDENPSPERIRRYRTVVMTGSGRANDQA